MFDLTRYLQLDPWTGLVRMISDRTYENLEPTHCTLVRLTPVEGLRTEVVIRTHRSTSPVNQIPPLPAELTYRYNRLDPSQVFNLTITVPQLPISSAQLLALITEETGTVFDVDDFQGAVFDTYGHHQLESLPASLRWVGVLTVNLVPAAGRELSDALTVKSSGDVFRLLSTTPGRQADFVYAAEHDFTPARFDLRAMIESPMGVRPSHLVHVLQRITKDPWVCKTTPSPYNCCATVIEGEPNYRVLYSGPPIRRYTPRSDKRQLIVLDLDENLCTALSGRLLLHYD